MTLKIIQISSLEGTVLGNIKLNGPHGTKLQKSKVDRPYREWLANMELLTEGKDYFPLKFEDYLQKIEECLNKYSDKKIIVGKKILSPELERMLVKYYSQQ